MYGIMTEERVIREIRIDEAASYNRAVRIMHRYCIMQHGFYVSSTIFLYFI